MAILLRSSIVVAALILGFLSVPTAKARPCKTLFITFTIEPVRLHRLNPNFIFINGQNPSDDRSVTIFSNEMFKPDEGSLLIERDLEFPRRVEEQQPSFLGLFPLPYEAIDFESMFDRSKDVLSVVVALLFGVGCGALTGATMYFVWMLVVGRNEDGEESYWEYDEVPSPKKGWYVRIAECVPAQVKEVA